MNLTATTARATTTYWTALILCLIVVIIWTPASAQSSSYSCASLCPNDGDVVTNPDQTVTYDWNSRVPVPSSTIGETVQTLTCAEFDVRLTTFDENDCTKHQNGLQAAGCQCGSGATASVVASTLVVILSVATSLMVWL